MASWGGLGMMSREELGPEAGIMGPFENQMTPNSFPPFRPLQCAHVQGTFCKHYQRVTMPVRTGTL